MYFPRTRSVCSLLISSVNLFSWVTSCFCCVATLISRDLISSSFSMTSFSRSSSLLIVLSRSCCMSLKCKMRDVFPKDLNVFNLFPLGDKRLFALYELSMKKNENKKSKQGLWFQKENKKLKTSRPLADRCMVYISEWDYIRSLHTPVPCNVLHEKFQFGGVGVFLVSSEQKSLCLPWEDQIMGKGDILCQENPVLFVFLTTKPSHLT